MPNVRLHATNFMGSSYYYFIPTYIRTNKERKHPSRVKIFFFHFLTCCTVQNGRSDIFFLLWGNNATTANLNIVKNKIEERKSNFVSNSTKNVTVSQLCSCSNIILSCHVIFPFFFFVLKQYVNESENVGEKEHYTENRIINQRMDAVNKISTN